MTTKAIFNIDKKLKEKAIRKANKQGINLSVMLNFATRAYVDDRLEVDILGELVKRARQDLREGKTVSQDDLFAKYGL
ncbi:MAG TPA: hypothetical protein VI483_00710 [Candidatus Paceibacterota bacterium]